MLSNPKQPKAPIDQNEARAIGLLCKISLGRGGWDRGFVADLAERSRRSLPITARQREHLWRLVRLCAKRMGDSEVVKFAQEFWALAGARAGAGVVPIGP